MNLELVMYSRRVLLLKEKANCFLKKQDCKKSEKESRTTTVQQKIFPVERESQLFLEKAGLQGK